MTKTHYATLAWDEEGQPVSTKFDDIYFSKVSGLEESHYVFLDHNQLAKRFTDLQETSCFVIGETGFGSGLNFLCAWQLFEQLAPTTARLHFISTEKYPLTKEDLRRALQLWPELQVYIEQLLAQYVAIHQGFQRLVFATGRVTLSLLIGDAKASLSHLNGKIDAWFLDGFSPAKNPHMWTDELFKQLARLSKNGTTLATFTSAGFVRRGLAEVGFNIEKTVGFANKREMLYGFFQDLSQAKTNAHEMGSLPWFARLAKDYSDRTAIVIGAGVAGCSSAISLAIRGWKVIVLEKREDIALEGSGNAQGILYLKLSAHQTFQSRLLVEGFGYTRRLLENFTKQGLLVEGEDWQGCGILQLAFDDAEQKRQQQLAETFSDALLYPVNQSQANEIAGVKVNHQGLFFPEGGWVKPRKLCKVLLNHPNIKVQCMQNVTSLVYNNQQWQAWEGKTLLACADIVVLANAADILELPMADKLPIKRIKGQTTNLPMTETSISLSTVICSDGYISPARDYQHCLGATFNFNAQDLQLNPFEHQQNIQTLKTISMDLASRLKVDELDVATLGGRTAYRCTATDYLPLVGPLADRTAFLDDYKVLVKDAKKIPNTPCQWVEGLFLNIAHGSRGLITAPLCGEMLASWLDNEPFPIEQDLMEACHPSRFFVRELRYFRRDQSQ